MSPEQPILFLAVTTKKIKNYLRTTKNTILVVQIDFWLFIFDFWLFIFNFWLYIFVFGCSLLFFGCSILFLVVH